MQLEKKSTKEKKYKTKQKAIQSSMVGCKDTNGSTCFTSFVFVAIAIQVSSIVSLTFFHSSVALRPPKLVDNPLSLDVTSSHNAKVREKYANASAFAIGISELVSPESQGEVVGCKS